MVCYTVTQQTSTATQRRTVASTGGHVLYNALPGQTWRVHIDGSRKLCQSPAPVLVAQAPAAAAAAVAAAAAKPVTTPPPTTKPVAAAAAAAPACAAFDATVVSKVAAPVSDVPTRTIVTLRLANGVTVEVPVAATGGHVLYNALPGQTWRVHVTVDGSRKLCQSPAPVLLSQGQVTTPCTAYDATVVSKVAAPVSDVPSRAIVNLRLSNGASVPVPVAATGGHVLYNAQPGQTWRVYVDAAGKMCQAPAPVLLGQGPVNTITPVTTKPVVAAAANTTKPVTTPPPTTKPVTTKPVTTKPVTTKPVVAAAISTTKPVTAKPVVAAAANPPAAGTYNAAAVAMVAASSQCKAVNVVIADRRASPVAGSPDRAIVYLRLPTGHVVGVAASPKPQYPLHAAKPNQTWRVHMDGGKVCVTPVPVLVAQPPALTLATLVVLGTAKDPIPESPNRMLVRVRTSTGQNILTHVVPGNPLHAAKEGQSWKMPIDAARTVFPSPAPVLVAEAPKTTPPAVPCTAVNAQVVWSQDAETPAFPKRRLIALRLPTGVDVKVHAMPDQPLHAAQADEAWEVYVAGGKVCMSPAAVKVSAAEKCTATYASVVRYKLEPSPPRAAVTLLLSLPALVERVIYAAPGTPLFDAQPNQVWKVYASSSGKVCVSPAASLVPQLKRLWMVVLTVTPNPTGTKAVTMKTPTGAQTKVTVDSNNRLYAAHPGQAWMVTVDAALKVQPAPAPVPVTPTVAKAGTAVARAAAPRATAVNAKAVNAAVAGVQAAADKSVAVTLRLPPTMCPQVLGVAAAPGQPLHAAKLGQTWRVYVHSGKVLLSPAPALLTGPGCAAANSAGMCTPWAAMVQRVREHDNKVRQVELAFNPGGTKRMDRTYAARPGTPMYDAKEGQVWKVWLRASDWNVCYQPAPEKMREKCKSRGELPVCRYDPGAAPTGTCSAWDGIVTHAPPAQTNGIRAMKLAFHVDGRRVDRGIDLRPGSRMYSAEAGQVWRVWLDDGNRAVCHKPEPMLSKLKCASTTELPACRYGGSAPVKAADSAPATCAPFAGLVTAIAGDSEGRKRLSLTFHIDGRKLERNYLATEGTAMYGAEVHQVWKVPLDTAAGHTVCYSPPPSLMRTKCSSADDLPVCQYVTGLPAGFMPQESRRGSADAGPLVTVWSRTSTTPPGYSGCYSNMEQLVCRKDDGTVSGVGLADSQPR